MARTTAEIAARGEAAEAATAGELATVATTALSSDVTIPDDLVVTDDATVGGDLVVTGTSTLTGAVELDGALNHDGATAGFFNVTPATRPAATDEIKAALASLGLLTDGGASPLNLDGGALTTGAVSGTTGAFSSTVTPTGGVVATTTPRIPTVVATSLTYGTDATPVATETYFAEIVVHSNTTLTGVEILVGSVGGTDSAVVALYNAAGAVVANSALAGTVVGTTAAWQQIPFTATYAAVGPAKYHVGLQVNGNTARYRAIPVGPRLACGKKTSEVFGTLTTITPPTAFTADVAPVANTY